MLPVFLPAAVFTAVLADAPFLTPSGAASFEVDLSPASQTMWSRFYSEGVSAGHIGLAARADYREHLVRCHSFVRSRFGARYDGSWMGA
jgi:hypothetical protein